MRMDNIRSMLSDILWPEWQHLCTRPLFLETSWTCFINRNTDHEPVPAELALDLGKFEKEENTASTGRIDTANNQEQSAQYARKLSYL